MIIIIFYHNILNLLFNKEYKINKTKQKNNKSLSKKNKQKKQKTKNKKN